MTDRPAETPLVSILIPAYAHEAWVAQCIESIWAQEDAPAFEIVACDDASPDATATILHGLAARSPVPMRVLENAENRGVCATLNRCLAAARGDWIAMIASDDMYMPRFLATNLAAARAARDPMVLMQSGAWRLRPDGQSILSLPPAQPTGTRAIRRALACGRAFIMAPSIFTSRAVFDATGGFDEDLSYEDLDFLMRAARVARFVHLREPLVVKRVVEGSLGTASEQRFRDRLACLRKNLGDAPDLMDEAIRGDLRRLAYGAGRHLDGPAGRTVRRLAREFGQSRAPLLGPAARGIAMGIARRLAGPGRLGTLRETLRRTLWGAPATPAGNATASTSEGVV